MGYEYPSFYIAQTTDHYAQGKRQPCMVGLGHWQHGLFRRRDLVPDAHGVTGNQGCKSGRWQPAGPGKMQPLRRPRATDAEARDENGRHARQPVE